MTKILYIINILRNFSCKSRPLSIKEITDLTNKYYDVAGGSEFINEVTTRRSLTSYLRGDQLLNNMPKESQCSSLNPSFFHQNYQHTNYKIHILFENPKPTSADDKYIDVTDKYSDIEYEYSSESGSSKPKDSSKKRKKEPKSYYYFEPFLSEEEITNLINIVESHPYYSSDEVIQITSALQSIAPAYFRGFKYFSPENEEMRANDSTLQNNLHDLHHFISENKDIIIEYSYYNEKKELIPHTGYPQQITPYQILWSNGYCYLAAYNPSRKNVTHYRVDRITYIEPAPEDEKVHSPFEGNPVKHSLKYAKEHPVMMSGKTISVSLLCQKNNSMVNRLLDSFGRNIRIQPADSDLLHKVFPKHPEYKPENWLNVTCEQVNPDGAALWAKQYCAECVLYAPAELARKTKQELQDAADRYL